MPRPEPHPFALFSLIPLNPRAQDVVAHPCNSHLVSTLRDGALALDIGFHIRSKSCNTLASLGRGEADIFVEGSSIARLQCSFEIDLDTNVVMLYDRSHGQTTQVFGENATPFEHGRIRKVAVQEELNTIVGMGGERRNLVQFELKWHPGPTQMIEKLKSREDIPRDYEENPRLARTIHEAETVLPSGRETRPHTPGHLQLKMRYVKAKGAPLGSGQFGTVYKAIDVDSGKSMAVKILEQPTRASEQEEWRISLYYALKREVETLSEISHPHIVDYIASQGWGEPQVEIFMGLKEGTLESLIESGSCSPVADSVFKQMLQALDCLAWKGIVHRDVKPENILYLSRPGGQYQFQLGDFGLCNRAISAATSVGTPLYTAPEMFWEGDQTHKVDVWSLFVTMLWTLDAGGFRRRSRQFKSYMEVQRAVLFAASTVDTVSKIREMAIVNPEERASAAQMLVKYYDGVGLSTPRNRIPALTRSPLSTIAAARTPARAPHCLTTRTTQTKPRAAQYRVEKARDPFKAKPFRRLPEIRPNPQAKS